MRIIDIKRSFLAGFLLAGFGASSLYADDIDYIEYVGYYGEYSGVSWTSTSVWSSGSVPTAGDDVLIDLTYSTPTFRTDGVTEYTGTGYTLLNIVGTAEMNSLTVNLVNTNTSGSFSNSIWSNSTAVDSYFTINGDLTVSLSSEDGANTASLNICGSSNSIERYLHFSSENIYVDSGTLIFGHWWDNSNYAGTTVNVSGEIKLTDSGGLIMRNVASGVGFTDTVYSYIESIVHDSTGSISILGNSGSVFKVGSYTASSSSAMTATSSSIVGFGSITANDSSSIALTSYTKFDVGTYLANDSSSIALTTYTDVAVGTFTANDSSSISVASYSSLTGGSYTSSGSASLTVSSGNLAFDSMTLNSSTDVAIKGSTMSVGALEGSGNITFSSLLITGTQTYTGLDGYTWSSDYTNSVWDTGSGSYWVKQTDPDTGYIYQIIVSEEYYVSYETDWSYYTEDMLIAWSDGNYVRETPYYIDNNTLTLTENTTGERADYTGDLTVTSGTLSLGSNYYNHEVNVIAEYGANQAFRSASTNITSLTINDGAQVHLNSTVDAGAGTTAIVLNSGGKLGAIGADYIYYAEEIGALEAKSLTWASGGALMVDVASLSQQYVIDTIVLSEGLYKAEGDTGSVYYIEFTALEDISVDYDYRFLEVYGDIEFDGTETFIGTVDNGNITITEENPGYCVESIWLEEYTNSSGESGYALYVSFAVVPEPSTYALIFGTLALALVAYKRRNRK